MSLARETHEVTQRLPDSERFGLCSQMRRAAVSMPSNIAEGFGRESTPDLLRFLRMGRGSLYELKTQFLLAVDLGLIEPASLPEATLDERDRVLQGLIRSPQR